MGLLDLFNKKKTEGGKLAQTSSGRAPLLRSNCDSLYKSDIVIQSIRCKANEYRKLEPRHIRTEGGRQAVITDSSVARVLKRPNELMTTSEFLEKVAILKELNKNVFIYKDYYITKGGEKYYTGLYPLKPREVTYIQDASGAYFLRFEFANGYKVELPKERIIHYKSDFGVNDFFGGNAYGQGENTELLRQVQEYDKLVQSVALGLDASYRVNGIVKVNTYLAKGKQLEEQNAFIEAMKNNEGGILVTDLSTEYTPISRDIKLVDAETLNYFYTSIARANGVSLAILNGDYTKAQKEAFFEHALEADIKALSQALTRGLFSDRAEGYGNEVVLYPNDIAFMSMQERIQALQAGLPAGIFTRNEARELLGFPPIENGDEIPQGYNYTIDAGGVNNEQ